MLNLRWTPDYAVGIAEIDGQHKDLIEKIHALSVGLEADKDDSTQQTLLAELADYTRYHFSLEEGMMEKHPIDPEFKAHHFAQHRYFVGVLKDFTTDFVAGRRDLSGPFIKYLVHWILHHIVVVDRELAKHLGKSLDTHQTPAPDVQPSSVSTELGDSERHLLTDMHHMIGDLRRQLACCLSELSETKARLVEIENWTSSCPRSALKAENKTAI